LVGYLLCEIIDFRVELGELFLVLRRRSFHERGNVAARFRVDALFVHAVEERIELIKLALA
jgi:hypothetical protein